MDQQTVQEYLLSFPNSWLGHPFGKGVAVFLVGPNPDVSGQSKMFALIEEAKKPVRLSLKCDPKLSEVLREKYEEVMPGNNLNKKQWNTLILSGQLEWDEVMGLIRHSYDLVVNELNT